MSKKYTEEQMHRIIMLFDNMEQSIEIEKRLKQMTDAEISVLLYINIWPSLEIYSPTSELVLEAVKRLNGGEMPFEEETDESN